jgi:hypothetical protein
MKTSKYLPAIFLCSLGSLFSLQGQDTILNRNVSVEREYRPVIHDAGKINSMPQVLEPDMAKLPAEYSDFNLPLNVGFNILNLPAAELITDKHININNGYARLAVGNYLNTLGDFAYPLINTPDTRLDFSLNHLATFDSKQMHSTTLSNLSFDKVFKTFALYAGLGGGHEYLKYYGNYYNAADSIVNQSNTSAYVEKQGSGLAGFPVNTLANNSADNTFWRLNVLVGVRSLPLSAGLNYQAEVQYQALNAANGISEKLVHTVAGFSSPSEQNRLGLDFELYNMIYTKADIPDPSSWQSYSVMKLSPYYRIDRPEYTVRLGFKSGLSFVRGKFMNPSADVSAEWKAIPKQLSIYGGLTGNYEVNTLNRTLTENPYIFSDLRLNDTYIPFDLFAGIKIKPIYNLLVDAYIDYKHINGQYFYVNKEYMLVNPVVSESSSISTVFSNRFNVVYSNASQARLGLRANYNMQDKLNVELKWAYNAWNVDTEQYAWNMPKYEAQVNAGYRMNDKLALSANLYYEGSRFAKLGTVAVAMQDKVDFNLGATYSYNNTISFFGKLNNLFNKKYQDYYGYDVQGTNILLGAAFSF